MSDSGYKWGSRSRDRLSTVHPDLVELVTKALHHADCPCDITVIEGHRTNERQAALYAQGRTAPGPRVTNAKPGQSKHNSMPSDAVDCGPCDRYGGVLWDDKDLFDRWGAHVKRVAEEEGIRVQWGGDFSWYDGAHFER
jgi:peptidoglycan L-alanyl-D-glutamate endopeptidase CwlK